MGYHALVTQRALAHDRQCLICYSYGKQKRCGRVIQVRGMEHRQKREAEAEEQRRARQAELDAQERERAAQKRLEQDAFERQLAVRLLTLPLSGGSAAVVLESHVNVFL